MAEGMIKKFTLSKEFMQKIPELLAKSREVLGDSIIADHVVAAKENSLLEIAIRTAIATGELKIK